MEMLSLDIYQSAAVGALGLLVGILILRRSETLRKFCIPAAVVGGLILSLVNLAGHESGTFEVEFDETLKNVFMMAFFCSVGYMASFRMLKSGGRIVLVLLGAVIVLAVMQNVIGMGMATAFGLEPKLGLCLGSISLIGGHGTAAGFGPTLVEDYGIADAEVVAIAAATFGLATSSFVGGPLARNLVEKNHFEPSSEDEILAEEEEERREIDNDRFLMALILLVVAIGLGTIVDDLIDRSGFSVPTYLGAMIVALIIRNICDARGVELPVREMSLLGTICLSMFISMALMVLKLWQLVDLALPMFVTLLVQVAFVALYAYFFVFRVTGRNYDAAAYTTAVCGFGLGATPNAVANMKALFDRYGEAPVPNFVVPLVGSVFIDIANSGILAVFLNLRRAGT